MMGDTVELRNNKSSGVATVTGDVTDTPPPGDVSTGCDVPEDFLQQWKRLSSEDQKAFEKYLKHMSLVDSGTVDVKPKDERNLTFVWNKQNPFQFIAPEKANTVLPVTKSKKDEQLEVVLDAIEFIYKNRVPRGLVLNTDVKQSSMTSFEPVEGLDKMREVLGKGNSAGEVTVYKDRKSGHNMALKTVMISQFNAHEIRLWIQMGDEGLAPELYHFELRDNKLVFTMEVMTGKDLQDVIDMDMWTFQDATLARNFSLCVLYDLLQIWEDMRGRNSVHADMHAGNLRLETSMKVKIFDFGRAKNLLEEDKPEVLVKRDIVGIIRVFCALYSGYDFNDVFHASKILEANNLKELDDCMIRISEESRKEMYHIMTMLFDTVRADLNSGSYGNTTSVSSHIRSILSEDMEDIKRKAAVIIFPEHFQKKGQENTDFGAECDQVDSSSLTCRDRDPIWDDINMDEFVTNVSDVSLSRLGLRLH